jgi:hypothetical protein
LAVCAGRNARTGMLKEFDRDQSFDFGFAPVPTDDSWAPARNDVVEWGHHAIDIARHAEVTVQKPRDANVTLVISEAARSRGVFAVRGDGAELRAVQPRAAVDGSFDVPLGPLRWFQPDDDASQRRQ